jgi:hypothetical protein
MGATPSPISDWAGRLTLLGAEIAYIGVVAYLVWVTWDASTGTPPSISEGIVGVAGALATAFGIGYAAVLGVTANGVTFAAPSGAGRLRTFLAWLNHVVTLNNLLGAGVFAYMAAGAALGVTYLWNQSESPGIVKTIAVAFGGYVIAYLGIVYRNYVP